MNDKDENLERQLRSQRGPREDGYGATRLPATLDPARRGVSGPPRLLRAGMLVGVAVAGALAVAVVGAILSGSNPGIGGTTSASPSASASPAPSPGDGMCDSSDVTFISEPWGGAAGSRGTTVTIALAAGRSACRLPNAVTAQIEDANGTVLVSHEWTGAGGSVVLEPGGAFDIGIEWSNWCGSDPGSPLTLSLKLDGWPAWVPVTPPAGGANPVPPCLGDAPSTLSLSGLQPRP